MRPSLHLGASQLTLLSLALLCSVPWTVTSYPRSPAALLPTVDVPDLESVLLHLQAALDDRRNGWLVQHDARAKWPRDPQLEPGEREEDEEDEEEEEGRLWEDNVLLRAQRGDLAARPLSPFPEGHFPEGMHYQEGGEGAVVGKKNEALTSIAGGLQAVSREKGGFGFRFGRKRWTDGRRMDVGGGSTEERGV
ncbi:uncharacterized protein qrfp [Acanthopagrus schlegelii]